MDETKLSASLGRQIHNVPPERFDRSAEVDVRSDIYITDNDWKMENGVLLNKLAQIEPYLARLEQVTPASFQDFDKDWKTQMIIERGLQVLIEIMIDVANRIVALKGWGPTTSSADAIRLLALKNILSSDQPYLKMIQFRNFIVHGYDKVNPAVVYGIVTRHLPDVRRFKDEVIRNG